MCHAYHAGGLRIVVGLLVGMSFCPAVEADVTARFDPADTTAPLGQVFTIDIVADIPDPVVAWGLDLTIDDGAVVSVVGDPVIGPDWVAAFAPDGDGLAGLAYPASVSGTDVLLATVTFSADAIGETDLFLSATAGDLNEGFGLDPTGFAGLTFETGHVTVPEPSAVCLLALGACATVCARRR